MNIEVYAMVMQLMNTHAKTKANENDKQVGNRDNEAIARVSSRV